MMFSLFLGFVACIHSQARGGSTQRVQAALSCDAQVKDSLHQCFEDIASQCRKSCASGLTGQESSTVGDWFDCYHDCVSKAGISCFTNASNALYTCKEDIQQNEPQQFQLPPPETNFQQRYAFDTQPGTYPHPTRGRVQMNLPQGDSQSEFYSNLKRNINTRVNEIKQTMNDGLSYGWQFPYQFYY
ncbi:hypothetical protein BLNAU_14834 [Blattamonas nauphoetae]|uniref:Uncharacterized protein n=1 Tax=Blattamonas nauphoetae TaxID=2049346 RepID=A0ABQ9XG99_9EUKA|nr:hypothetical protein BLNAU_14834 [Blattamonas nauphoetae]